LIYGWLRNVAVDGLTEAHVPEFDHHSVTFASEWREQYRELRDSCPVAHVDGHGGFTVLTRYDDIRHVLHTPKEFICARDLEIEGLPETVPGGVTIPTNPFRMGMMEMDAPQSLNLRRLLVPWFSVKAVQLNAVHIHELVTWCIDRVIESGRIDIVDDLANPLPALVMLDLLGMPLENWPTYASILHGAAYREKGSVKGLAWLRTDLATVVAQRRADPPAVLTPIDALIAAQVDGEPLSDDLVVELVYMLLSGGVDTSTALIAHIMRYLSAHSAVADELRADPALIPDAVEEMLRYFTPGTGVARTARHDTSVGDVEVKAGERILLALGAANLDPSEFEHPDELDIHRDAGRHLAFGAGMHRCLGSFLAPREVGILIGEILQRMPDLHIDEDGVEPYETIPLVSGYRAMPATFTPGPKIGLISTDGLPPARSERDLRRAAELAREDVEDEATAAASPAS
jgi:cytochrome P450